ncbi:DegT/DnrJ/EryC1/StrS family aminotransferase [Kribbella sp. NPDC051587]|uniref:DegT/DnrJ/EryC1/StrS family aminotransferase n=1 Tax=Kribbella sp. NPDC051587 TaxID=3364119 RepID=UPI0037A3C570
MRRLDVPAQRLGFTDLQKAKALSMLEKTLTSGHLSAGPWVAELEERIGVESRGAEVVAVSNATTGMFLSLQGLGVTGASVLVPTNTTMATFSAVIAAGCRPVLVDCAPGSLTPGLNEYREAAVDDVGAIVAVHVGGYPSRELHDVAAWARMSGYAVVEDAAHAHGLWTGDDVGVGDVAVYSLYATKVMTAGEGGLVITANSSLAAHVRSARNHGKGASDATPREIVGFNGRMGETAAAIALVSLDDLSENIAARLERAGWYDDLLAGQDDTQYAATAGNGYKYVVSSVHARGEIRSFFSNRGVALAGEVFPLPLHLQPAVGIANDFPNADAVCRNHYCLPIFPSLTRPEAEYVASVALEYLGERERLLVRT